ncbi:hypothetical protein Q8A67_011841 [Cirrhinus molitorella]|uniref:Uncharacterized protein n=1 Tax=Cirrhinus molitorella TaxID=172907 RepID=A0AA88PP13_9TELE|nr:hypothetical protein Q8A67_011841 [Cirrhinus molitorella]
MQSKFDTLYTPSQVFTVLSSALLLVSLLPLCTQSVDNEVDQNTLYRITEFFRQTYEIGQFAVTINVPMNQCENGFIPSTSPVFLTQDRNVNVKIIISVDNYPVYNGIELIAAGIQKTPTPAHSEFLLMNPLNASPLTVLLNKRNDGCVIFYTLNSPCINTCLSTTNWYNIIPGLDKLQAYQGIKAFAFSNIWIHDQNNINELKEKLQEIASRIPLYRCFGGACTLCGKPGSNAEINGACLNV